MKKNNIAVLLLLTSSLFGNLSLADQIYKWTDEKGVTHYSAKKPSNTATEIIETKGKKKSSNKIPFTTEAAPNNPVENKTLEEKPQTTAATAPVEEKKVAVKQEIKKDKATCERAKKSEITLRNTPLVKQGGKILTIEEKNQQLANVREIIKIHCN